jgi:3-oxoacyl-[acyl-carrier protein] reductase
MFEDPGLRGKVVLVTGGSRGIGREIVLGFAGEGSSVLFFYRQDEAAAREVCGRAESEGWDVAAERIDIRDRAACDGAVRALLEKRSRIDVLVNNGGIIRDNLLAFFTEEEVRDVIETNVLGAFNVTRAVTPTMVAQRSGKIINISSISASKPGRGQSNYAASKAAIEAMTRALAVELAPKKIMVNAVAPGVIETDMSRNMISLAGEEVRSRILLNRFGKPSDVAPAVLFLASRFADYITGEVLHVDGGFKMG